MRILYFAAGILLGVYLDQNHALPSILKIATAHLAKIDKYLDQYK